MIRKLLFIIGSLQYHCSTLYFVMLTSTVCCDGSPACLDHFKCDHLWGIHCNPLHLHLLCELLAFGCSEILIVPEKMQEHYKPKVCSYSFEQNLNVSCMQLTFVLDTPANLWGANWACNKGCGRALRIQAIEFTPCTTRVSSKTVVVNRYLNNGLSADCTEQECHCNLTRPSLPCGSGPTRLN